MDRRLKRVLDYIDIHLHKDMSLIELASISGLSHYHFSRIFSLQMDISLSAYIKIKRLERAEAQLIETDLPIAQIAVDSGFTTLSNFNSAFKARNGMSPRDFRKSQLRNIQIEQRNGEGEFGRRIDNNPPISDFIRRIIAMNLNEVVLADMDVAYVSQQGSYLDTGRLWQRLLEWAIPRQLFPPTYQFFGISYDEPDVADDQKTTDACVVLPAGFAKQDEAVQYKMVQGGRFLLYSFYDRIDRLALVYKQVVTEYLPNSSYDLDDRDFLEFVMNDPGQDPEGKTRIDLYIPIRERAE